MANTPRFSLAGRRVWVAGHRGMVGAALLRRLEAEDCEILTADRLTLDLRRQSAVEEWMNHAKPDAIFLAAGLVGGVHANNSRPADFLYDNLAICSNIIHHAWRMGVAKLLYLGSSCIYPRMAPQPMAENLLLTGPLEATNEWYAVAKIAGIKLCQAYRRQYGCEFISAMPTNLYGQGDNYDLNEGHVVAALISKIHNAKMNKLPEVSLWGTGTPLREFLYVDDLADALVFLMENYSEDEHINVGTGAELSIAQLAGLIARIAGYEGQFVFDSSKPDGTPRKLMNIEKLAKLGWSAPTDIEVGMRYAYRYYADHVDNVRRRAG